MSRPLLWPKKVFFYPIGNTPAVCLTETLPPEQPAEILLLGCGDPRNILYTTFCDLNADRQIDVTCCDADPAILARNVFVYTLLLDENLDSLQPTIWDIFYHFYIDDESMGLISKHCKRLLDLSSSLDTWHRSKYGEFLRFCTYHALLELQRQWMAYIETAEASPAAKKNLFDLFAAGMKEVLAKERFCGLPLRAAGPLWQSIGAPGMDLHQYFWTNGVTSSAGTVLSGSLHANPLFAYSLAGKGFETHYSTEPISCFHLITPLASDPTRPTKCQDLVDFARSEFGVWCRAFANHVKNGKITVRLFVGDALAFAHALHYYSKTGDPHSHIYTSSWGNSLIELHKEDYSGIGNAPSNFNVINTSNLSDHLGMLNLLTACLPLLQVSASATLQTDTLHPPQNNSNTPLDRLYGDFAALSSLFGITSKTHVSGFATHFSASEVAVGSQLHERISWKWTEFISSTVTPSTRCNITLEFDAKQLAMFLFNIHQQMFAEESKLWADVAKTLYTRTSSSFLLIAVMARTRQNWSHVLDHLTLLVGSDRKLFLSACRYQDFCCQLHLHGIHSVESILNPTFLSSQTDLSLFKNHTTIPSLTCIAFLIPREKIRVLEKARIGTPILLCQVGGPRFLDMFSSIRPTLGEIDATRSDGVIVVNDDPRGWSGTSPLIVSFWVPSWILMVDPSLTRVSLCFEPTQDAIRNLLPVLGKGLCIFSASLQDRRHVFISSQRPGNEKELECHKKTLLFKDINSPDPLTAPVRVALNSTAQMVSTFTTRKDVTTSAARRSLSSRAAVTTTQISSCALRVAFESQKIIFPFPFPIDGSKAITRIARSSFYIEVEVPTSDPHRPGGFMFQRFPVIKGSPTPIIWNIPYVKLDSTPRLVLGNPQKLGWLKCFIACMHTAEERTTWSNRKRNVLSDIKRTISGILFYAAGMNGHPNKWFYLTEPTKPKAYTILFIDGLRLDPASLSVVIDAFALPLTYAVIEKTGAKLGSPARVVVPIDSSETDAWAHLLPIFAERCRTWKHTAKCEYISENIPLSTNPNGGPLCSCGKGKGISFPDQWKQWNKFASLFTRVAISPMFPPHILDVLGNAELSTEGETAESHDPPPMPSPCCAACDGPGKPILLACGACKRIKYCSNACQKSHWAIHKAQCKMAKAKGAA